MPEVLAAKTGHNTFTVHPNFLADLEYLNLGGYVKIKFVKARNPEFHKKYWAMISALFNIEEIQEYFKTREEVHNRLKIDSGHCTTTKLQIEDAVVYHHIAKSINFDAMDETEFNDFYNRAINVILMKWLPEFVPGRVDQYADYFARNF